MKGSIIASIAIAFSIALCIALANTAGAATKKAEKSMAIKAGKRVYAGRGCSECHRINGKGGRAGPNLTHIGKKRSKAWIRKQITDSKAHFKDSFMPLYKHPPRKDLNALVSYLSSLR